MSEIRRIEEQLQRSFEGGSWHGPAVLEVLAGLTPEKAAARPVPAAHTIWEIVLHMATWKRVAARRVKGEVVARVPDEVDWPKVESISEADWSMALRGLNVAHAELRAALHGMHEEQLDESPYAEAASRYVQIHGAIQHDLYHAGQIAVLKKA